MTRERSFLIGVLWRVAVMLLLFNPVASLSQWMLASWSVRPGVVIIVAAVVALVLLYMLSLAREFIGATVVAALAIAAILAGCALQGWVNLADLTFWQWAAPIVAGILFAAGPAFATIRRREAGVSATDETNH
jgi:Family of unknown function (DUF6524)